MKSKIFHRNLMVVAGILAAVIILLSPAVQQETRKFLREASADAGKTGENTTQLVVVPSDAVTSSHAGLVETVNPFVIQEIIVGQVRENILPFTRTILSYSFARAVLSTVISPQAP